MIKKFIILMISMLFIMKGIGLTEAKVLDTTFTIPQTERNILKSNSNQINTLNQLIGNILKTECYDNRGDITNEVNFICKNDWKGANKSGCGIERNTLDYKKGYYCDLKRTDKNLGIRFNLNLPKINDDDLYPKRYDITNTFSKKTIQEKSLSCESSATSDILTKHLGKKITEDDVISVLPKSDFYEKEAIMENGKRMWGNPNEGFVGLIDKVPGTKKDALQWKYEGYGVYETPISEVYNHYGIKNSIITKENRLNFDLKNQKEHLTFLLKELTNGNDIQLWGDRCTYPKYEDGKNEGTITTKEANYGISGKNECVYPYRSREISWYYKDNNGNLQKHTGLNGEHAFYLLGYKGAISKPTHIIVWDTQTGKHTYETNEWLRKWGKMDDKSIVVYK